MRPLLNRLRADERGTTIIEFAIILPVMLLVIMGLSELTYQLYMQSVLTGAMQKAGRDGTIQGNQNAQSGDQLSQRVLQMVQAVNPSAAFAEPPSRKSYASFGNVAPEQFVDNNHNGRFDPDSECFTDVNGDGKWNVDPGQAGGGGANDIVDYRITVKYPRLFPMAAMFGWSPDVVIGAETVLKNQPYAKQDKYQATQICPKN